MTGPATAAGGRASASRFTTDHPEGRTPMRLDFWNNPIVISSMRRKFRRGGLTTTLTAYAGLLGVCCLAGLYFGPLFFPPGPGARPLDRDRLHTVLFIGLIGVQFFFSCLLAIGECATSMTQEVTTGTLDFQRLTGLTPLELLVGKLAGGAALASFLALASIPIAVCLLALDVPNVTPVTLALIYLNMASTLVLCGSVGLIHTLQQAGGQTPQGGGSGCAVAAMMLPFWMSGAMMASSTFTVPWTGALVGLATPLGMFAGLVHENDPWFFKFTWFGMTVPFLIATPLAQLALAGWVVNGMARRLPNPSTPALSKFGVYVAILAIDILFAGLVFEPVPAAPGLVLAPRVRVFWIAHFLAAILLVSQVTPGRELFQSWIWRFRGRAPWAKDAWLDDRSENILVLATVTGLGLAVYLLLVVAPALLTGAWPRNAFDAAVAVNAPLVVSVLVLSSGTCNQWTTVMLGRGGWFAVVALFLLSSVVPHVVGESFGLPGVTNLSASAHVASWFDPRQVSRPAVGLVALYGLLFWVAFWSFRRRVRKGCAAVDAKLVEMLAPPADGSPIVGSEPTAGVVQT